MGRSLKVAVIGAGVSGLTAARALKRERHRVVVYEKSSQLGGTWVYDPRVESDPLGVDPNREIVHSSMYHSLRTNLPRELMGFSDYPFPRMEKDNGSGNFPGREEVLEFLNDFAEEFGLVELIRFNSEVVRVERFDPTDDEWVVEWRSRCSLGSEEEVFDAVVVCSGHHTRPRLPHLPGMERWPGKQMHSHNYRVPDPFQDQIVIVIGGGASAHDISLEVSKVAKEVHLSLRSPNVQISKLDCADNLWQHSKIVHLHDNGEVAFEDGTLIHADIILHCTGFEYDFPFLKTDGIVSVDDNRVGPLYKHIFPPKLAPTLSFIGLSYRVIVLFMMMDLQAKWVAHILSGKASLPSDEKMMAEIEDHYRRMEEGAIPKHHSHCIGHLQQFEYLDWLANQVGVGRVDERIKFIGNSYRNFYIGDGEWKNKEWELNQEELKELEEL